MINRRNFMIGAFAGGALSLAAVPLQAQTFTTEDLEVSHFLIKNKRIPASFNGYRIAFISDIHCGVFLSQNLLENTISLINRESPDILLLGGDYIGIPDNKIAKIFTSLRFNTTPEARSKSLVTSIFKRFCSALKYIKVIDGIHGVLGNHDHWNDGAICHQIMSESGVNILVNQGLSIRREKDHIIFFGTDDFWTGIPKVTSDFLNNKNDFKVLVSHNPDFISNTIRRHNLCFDLALAGHTHGGQIYLKGIGPLGGYAVKDRQFFTGNKILGESVVHTSRGIGVVDIPYRLNSRPEISIFTLERA